MVSTWLAITYWSAGVVVDAQLIEVLRGEVPGAENVMVVDARYDYEYAGGHIRGAINLSDPQVFMDHFCSQVRQVDAIVIHCEFSSKRGPRLSV